jgi:two-component system response regulator HydG
LQFEELFETPAAVPENRPVEMTTPSTPATYSNDIPLSRSTTSSSGELSLKNASIDAEYETIIEALKKSNFNKSKAAKLLNIDRKTLYNKMKQYQEFNNH